MFVPEFLLPSTCLPLCIEPLSPLHCALRVLLSLDLDSLFPPIMPRPAKRKAAGKQKEPETKVKQPKQDGQKAVSHDLEVPLDEGFYGK